VVKWGSSLSPDRPKDAVLYSEKLLGLRGDCNIPHCREREDSTGWLLYDVDTGRWFIGLSCPAHGQSGAWRPEWQHLIDEAIESEARGGFDIAAALRALRE
jgi:hypothetical protein